MKKSEKWPIEDLKQYQFLKCKSFLQFTYENSEFYKEYFDRNNFKPNEINSINDIKALPPLDKDVLLKNAAIIHTKYPFKKMFFSETSGTSGQPLRFYRNEEWDSHNRAAMFRGYSWYNVKPWDKNGYFWGYNIDKKKKLKIRYLDFLQNRFRLFSYQKNDIICFIKKLKSAKYLHGYSSMIYEVAKIINKEQIPNRFKLTMIKGTSEKIYDNYHEETVKAFGQKIVSEYGAAESGLIAFECPNGSMHINIENVIVEIDNGEILVTNLMSKSFPIVRYRLGDSVQMAPDNFSCLCGRQHPVILDIQGRVGKRIIGKNESYPSLTFYNVFKNIALNNNIVLNYQAVQDKPGLVVLKIEQEILCETELLKKELEKYFKNDVDFEILCGQDLHKMDGKLRDFITTLD